MCSLLMFGWTTNSRRTAISSRANRSRIPALLPPPSLGRLWAAPSRAPAPPVRAIKTPASVTPTQSAPRCINDIRVGLNRQTTALTQEDYGQNLSQQFGIPGVNVSPQTSGLSNLDVAGLFDIGDSLLTPLQINTTDWNVTDKITWVKGRHVIHVGIDYQHEMGSTGYLVYGRGFYTFLNLSTSSLVGAARRQRVCQLSGGRAISNPAGRVSTRLGGTDFLSCGFLCAG